MSLDREDNIFDVVLNHEDQYSIWPVYKPLPAGWRKAGYAGQKEECLAHIDETWTDMRPRSLRKHIDGPASRAAQR